MQIAEFSTPFNEETYLSESERNIQKKLIKKEIKSVHIKYSVAEFKEFERRFKFKPRFKYGWFHLKLYQMFQDLSRRFI